MFHMYIYMVCVAYIYIPHCMMCLTLHSHLYTTMYSYSHTIKRSLLVTGSNFDIAGGTCTYNDGSLDYNSICYSG